jgi:hypothetical protein
MNPLDGLGLQKRWIYEVVVTTLLDGRPHAAPMGVWTDDFRTLQLDLYEGSRTLAAIVRDRHFVANFPRDATTLAAALSPCGELAFVPAVSVASPRLGDASASVELVLTDRAQGATRTRLVGAPVHISLGSEPPRLINRAESLLLESLVIASRLERRAPELAVAALKENLRIIRKVAPDSSFAGAMDELLRSAQDP